MRFGSLLATLGIITWMSSAHATQGPVSSCCPGWSNTRVRVQNVANYTIQSEGACAIKAVVFQTKVGKTICSSPNSVWAKKAMLKVDEELKRLQGMGVTEQASTSGIMPAAMTVSKNVKKGKKGMERRRGRKNKSKRGRKMWRQRKYA
ncbi:C-C motif chemokine 4-like isoform X1 [Solea senegalensis]|uniref:C-C motif chemokine 4-like isoform X1 n=1 Tax=Solea senegalensis TaxID=28829 RepID=A0AAV6T5X2_SOLSE|nr:eotaxin-like [Solea senegalensis]KAG7524807.1 C-C motif chemokine 4-like isoform X1 [Solea senegalensis]